jgi:DNA-directed RNA polymerase specialized sigma24 family protein
MHRTGFDGVQFPDDIDVERLVAWDQLLEQLAAKDAVMANVVKLRYFAGFTVGETAQALELSARTVNRHWTAAQAWLRLRLAETEQDR